MLAVFCVEDMMETHNTDCFLSRWLLWCIEAIQETESLLRVLSTISLPCAVRQ